MEEGKMAFLKIKEEFKDQDWVVKESIDHLYNHFTSLRNKPRIAHIVGKVFHYFSISLELKTI